MPDPLHETQPRWKSLGLPEDAPPINPYVRINGDSRVYDDARTPEHPGDKGYDRAVLKM